MLFTGISQCLQLAGKALDAFHLSIWKILGVTETLFANTLIRVSFQPLSSFTHT